MVHTNAITFAAAALLAAAPVNAGLYPRGSQVTVVDGKSFDRLINQSNYTSVRIKHLSHSRGTGPVY